MNRRKFLERTSVTALTGFAAVGVASADDVSTEAEFVTQDCECDGTYEECCGVDGPCECFKK